MRATASGSISFGLVNIPVKLYTGARSKAISFNMLHNGARVKQQLTNGETGEMITYSDTVKGYEYSKGKHVTLTRDEIGSLRPKKDQSISIAEFIPGDQVDPIYFDKSYLVGPEKGANKSYGLLHSLMLSTGQVAIGRYCVREKENVVLLRAVEHGIMLHTLFYHDEVRSFDDLNFDIPEASEAEVALGQQLLESMSRREWHPEAHEDTFRREILALVERKVSGEEIIAPETSEEPVISDMVAALQASLNAGS